MGALDRYYERQKKNRVNFTSGSSALDRYNKRMRYNSIDTTGVDQSYIDTFFNDANAFLTTAEKDYGGLGWGNASATYEDRNTSWQDLNTRADTISAWLYQNRDRLDSEAYKKTGDAISSFRSSGTSVVDAFKGARDLYALFDTEDAYNTWYENYKRQEEEKAAILGAEDFEDYFNKANADGEMPTPWERLTGNSDYNSVANMRNDPMALHVYESSAETANGASWGTVERRILDDLMYKGAKWMTDDEFKVYNYYYGKDMEAGTDTAMQYLKSIEETLNKRAADEKFADLERRTFAELLFGIEAGLDQFESGLLNLADDRDYIPATPTQMTSGMVREDLADNGPLLPDWMGGFSLGQMGYDAVTTTSNMLPSILTSAAANIVVPGSGAIVGAGLMGASASGNAYAEMLNLGYTKEQARSYSLLVGASEAGLSYALGGIGKLGGKLSGKAITKFVSQFDNAIARTAIKLGGSMLSEGLEESIQSVLEPVFKSWATGEDFEGIAWDEVIYSGVMGAVSALTLEGAAMGAGAVGTYTKGKALKSMGTESIDRLVSLGQTFSADTVAYQLAGKVNGNTGAYTIGRLLNEVGASLSEQNKTDIAKALEAKGMTSKDANTISKWLGKAVDGGYFNKRQIAALENNEIISSVFKDVIIDQNSTVNQRIQGYNETLRALAEKKARSKTAAKPTEVQQTDSDPSAMLSDDEIIRRIAEATGEDVSGLREKAEKASVTKSEADIEGKAEANFEVSESGETIYKDAQGNARDAKVKSIASTEGGLKVELESGETVKASDLSFGTKEEALMYEMVARMEATPDTANDLINTFKPSNLGEATRFFSTVPLAYQYGKMGYEAGLKNVALPGDLAKYAYNRGRMDAIVQDKSKTAEKQAKIVSTVTKNAENISKTASKKESGKASAKKNGIFFENGYVYDESKANDLQKASMAGIETISKMSNLEVHVYESWVDKNGNRVYSVNGVTRPAPNGYYVVGGNKIYIDINAGGGGEGAMLYTASHEVGHFIKEWNAEGFRELGDFLIEQYGKKGVSVDALLEAQKKKIRERYKRNNETLPSEAELADMAYEELVCDAMSDMFADPKAYENLAKLKAQNKTLWEKLGEAIKALLDKLKTILGVYKEKGVAVAQEAHFVREFSQEVYDKLQDLYLKAFVEADANYAEASEIDAESGDIAFSIRNSTEIEDKSVRYYKEHKPEHIDQEMFDAANGMIQEMVDYMKPYLDITNNNGKRFLPEEIIGNTIFKNGSYGKTIENTTICYRTLAYIDFTNEIKKKIGRPLTVEESFLASQMLYEIAKDPQCLYCYVSLDRKAYDGFLLEYTNQMNSVIDGYNALESKDKKSIDNLYKEFLAGRKDTKPMRARFDMWVDVAKSNGERIALKDLTTEEVRSDIISKGGVLAKQIIDAERYAQSASWAKKLEQYRSYNSEILRMSPNVVKQLNSHYGLRFYSFSEYTAAFIVENMQQIRDASLRGLFGLGYTKETDFAKIFASTGMNINMSVFGKMQNGEVIPDTRQGADWDEVKALRKKYKNVGAVFVATNDELVDWALAQDWIDVVIPFHIVRTGANIAEFYKWVNNTQFQADKDASGKNKTISPTEHHNDLDTFMRLVKERGLTPRFDKWVDNPNYMKLVNETRLSVDESTPLVPKFNLNMAKDSFDEFVGEGGYYGNWYRDGVEFDKAVDIVAADVVSGAKANEVDYGRQDLTEEEIAELKKRKGKPRVHNGTKYSDRDSTYLDAVNRGDMETAQRMVDEAAKAAGYTEEVFHGMGDRYNIYKSGNGQYGSGVYFTYDKSIAQGYGTVVDHLYVKVGKIADYDDAYETLGKRNGQTLDEFARTLGFPSFDEMIEDWDNDPTDVASNSRLMELLKNKGFEGFVDEGNAGFVLWDFDGIEYRIKLADPVTYDDNGDVIPLSERFNAEESDIRYSERDTTSVSNRTLLAGALESVAQNDIERSKLDQYKAKIALVESEQKKLAEIRSKANELRFTKGRTAEETKQMRDLDAEATKIANRISTYDKQLLNLEATTALKNVLEREKANLRKDLEAKGREALREQRQRNAETVKGIVTHYQESRKKAVDGRHKTEMRHKIKNVVSDLNKLLLNPTKEQYVPIGLQLVVAEALDAINMDTMNAEERVAYYNDLISKSSDPDEIAMLKKKRDFFEYRDATFKERITALKNAYAEFKVSDDPLIRNAHNEVIEELIKDIADAVGDKSLKDMSLAQLESVYNMYKAILATVRNSNKMFKEGRQETVTENSESVKTEVKAVGGHQDRVLKLAKFFKKFGWDMLKPVTAMKVIGSKTFESLFSNVRAAEDTWAVDVHEAKEFYEGVAKKYNFKKWDFKKWYSFKDSNGNDFSVSLEQIMSLYAYSKRDQADKHLEFGGFIFDDAIEVTEKKLGIPLKYEVNDANPYRLGKEHVLAITNALTAEQKAFVDEMQTYLSEVMGEKGNEVSLAMYDIKLYNEKNYFPLKTSRYFREFDPEKSGTPRIKNPGFSKKTVPQAGNPIVLSNFMDVWAGHVNDMSMYHAFVLPLEDFMRVYNYSSTAGGYDSVQQAIKNAYGAQANQYVERLMDDLNGGARVDSSAGVISKGISLFKKASVFASASVVVQQPSAIARAFAYINPKYFATSTPAAMNLKKHKAVWAEVKKYAPVAVIKEMGYFDTGVGRSTVEWIKGDRTWKAKMDDALSKAPAMADELAWCHIWEAVKRETEAKKNLKAGSEEFYKECGRRFTEVITNTQVYDSVLARSGMMRSKDTGMKMATAFMAEPTTTVNMMVDGIIQGKRGNKKFLAATVGAVASSVILNAILVSLVYAARDDDEDETYAEKYIGSVTSELLDGFNPLTYVPFVKDIWSIAQGYDVERSDMSVVSKLWESVEGLFKEDKSGWEKVLDVSGSVSSLFGIPLKNIIRDSKGMYNLALTLTSGTQTTGAGVSESVEDSFKSSIPLWDRLNEPKSNADRLYEAILSGDRVQIERIENRFKDEKAVESAIRKALRENDTRIKEAAQARYEGDISEYTRIAKDIIKEGNFSQDDVVAAINAEMNAIKRDEEGEEETETTDKDEATSIYSASDINAAFEDGDNSMALEIIQDLIDTKVSNGKTEKEAKSSLRSSMTSYWKPLYKEAYQSGDSAEMLRIRRILYASGLYGSQSDVVETVKSWLKN